VEDDVFGWYDYLKENSVCLLTEAKEMEGIRVRGFFLEDPGGYTIGIQRCLLPDVDQVFR
jgi:hypothetical protein